MSVRCLRHGAYRHWPSHKHSPPWVHAIAKRERDVAAGISTALRKAHARAADAVHQQAPLPGNSSGSCVARLTLVVKRNKRCPMVAGAVSEETQHCIGAGPASACVKLSTARVSTSPLMLRGSSKDQHSLDLGEVTIVRHQSVRTDFQRRSQLNSIGQPQFVTDAKA